MSSRSTVFRAAWVLPVAAPPLRGGAVLVDGDGIIAAVGPAAAIRPHPDAEIVDLGEAVLLPGLVNVHAHPELSMFRGALEELAFRDWILRLVGAKRSVLRDEDYLWAARWGALEAIRAGMTTVACTEASGAAMEAFRESGVRGIVYQEVFCPDPARVEESMDALRRAVSRMRERESDLVRVGISPHAPYTVSDPLYRAVANMARSEDLPVALHAAEALPERLLVREGKGDFAPGLRARGIPTHPRGRTTIELLDRLGVLEVRPLLIHCVDLEDDDVRRIAEHDCAVAHCPVANAKLGHGVAPVPRLLEAGVRVGLGTDSVGSNNRLDLLEEARIASLLQRAVLGDFRALPADELLRLCTIDGARALGLDRRVGTLEPGKDADLCAVSLEAPHTRPVHDPVAALFHSARGTDVVLTVVRGRVLFRDGRVQTLDTDAVGRAVEVAAERLREMR